MLGISISVASGLWSKTAEAAKPKKGGHFVLGMGHGSTTDSLDPAATENFYQTNFGYTRHNHIAEVSPEGKLVPELAESWEATPDAKTWHFKVRRGVEFHNGKTLTVEDVIYSLNHHRKEESKSAAKAYLKSITDIKTDGKEEQNSKKTPHKTDENKDCAGDGGYAQSRGQNSGQRNMPGGQ